MSIHKKRGYVDPEIHNYRVIIIRLLRGPQGVITIITIYMMMSEQRRARIKTKETVHQDDNLETLKRLGETHIRI